jgi:hypothetical protein
MGIINSIKKFFGISVSEPVPIQMQNIEVKPSPHDLILVSPPIENVVEPVAIKKIRKSLEKDKQKVSLEKHEIAFIAKKYGVKPAVVRKVVSEVGPSRRKIYSVLNKL